MWRKLPDLRAEKRRIRPRLWLSWFFWSRTKESGIRTGNHSPSEENNLMLFESQCNRDVLDGLDGHLRDEWLV